jgi:hypothetical protein
MTCCGAEEADVERDKPELLIIPLSMYFDFDDEHISISA